MLSGKNLVLVILVAIIVRMLAFNYVLDHPNINILQDNYIGYIQILKTEGFNSTNIGDSRLFPGYPILLLSIQYVTRLPLLTLGIILNIVLAVLAIILFNRISKDRLATIIFSIIPPVWVLSSVKISTEPLTVLLLLTSIYFFLKRNYLVAGSIIGLATGVRLISICLLGAFVIMQLIDTRREIIKTLAGFLIFFCVYLLYNQIIFGNIIHQFYIYPSVGGASGSSIGIIQLLNDIPRALDWKQYRILTSGLSYITIYITSIIIMFRLRKKSALFYISFLWLTLSLIFILLYGPSPLLEEFARFTVPVTPAIALSLSALIGIVLKKYNSNKNR